MATGVFSIALGNYDASFPCVWHRVYRFINRYFIAYDRNSIDFIWSFGKDGELQHERFKVIDIKNRFQLTLFL